MVKSGGSIPVVTQPNARMPSSTTCVRTLGMTQANPLEPTEVQDTFHKCLHFQLRQAGLSQWLKLYLQPTTYLQAAASTSTLTPMKHRQLSGRVSLGLVLHLAPPSLELRQATSKRLAQSLADRCTQMVHTPM